MSRATEVGNIIDEATITHGMRNVMGRLTQTSLSCRKCKYTIPKYRGRYPKHCPECDSPLGMPSKAEQVIKDLEQ